MNQYAPVICDMGLHEVNQWSTQSSLNLFSSHVPEQDVVVSHVPPNIHWNRDGYDTRVSCHR